MLERNRGDQDCFHTKRSVKSDCHDLYSHDAQVVPERYRGFQQSAVSCGVFIIFIHMVYDVSYSIVDESTPGTVSGQMFMILVYMVYDVSEIVEGFSK